MIYYFNGYFNLDIVKSNSQADQTTSMNVKVKTPSILYVDNQSAIKISENDF